MFEECGDICILWVVAIGYGRIGGLSVPCLIKFWVSHILGTVPDDLVADFIAIKIVFIDFGS